MEDTNQPIAPQNNGYQLNPWQMLKDQLSQLRTNILLITAPGNKQFRDISKRFRLMLTSFMIPSIFLILKVFLIEEVTSLYVWIAVSFALSVITYFATLWGLKFHIRKESYLSVLNLPPLFVFTVTLFISFVFLGPLNRVFLLAIFIVSIGIFMLLLYILLLAVNVLNVNLFYVIPLGKLAETLQYFYSVVCGFLVAFSSTWLLFYAAQTNDVLLVVLGVFVLFMILAIMFFETIYYYTPVQGGAVIFSVLLTLVMMISLGIYVLLLPYMFLACVILSLQIYVILGLMIHKSQNTLKVQIYVEYLVIFGLILLTLLLI